MPEIKDDPSVAVFVWHTDSKTLTLIKEFAPGREEVAYGVVAGLYEKDKHDSPLQAAKYEVSVSIIRAPRSMMHRRTISTLLASEKLAEIYLILP